jgi:hypothetical protein
MNQAQRNKLQDAIVTLNGSVDRSVLNAVVRNLHSILNEENPYFWLICAKTNSQVCEIHRRGCRLWNPADFETVDDFQAGEILLAWNHWRGMGFPAVVADCCRGH